MGLARVQSDFTPNFNPYQSTFDPSTDPLTLSCVVFFLFRLPVTPEQVTGLFTMLMYAFGVHHVSIISEKKKRKVMFHCINVHVEKGKASGNTRWQPTAALQFTPKYKRKDSTRFLPLEFTTLHLTRGVFVNATCHHDVPEMLPLASCTAA